MTSTTRKPLTTLEQFDLHAAYHVSGMMERGCNYCTDVIYSVWSVQRGLGYQEYFAGGK